MIFGLPWWLAVLLVLAGVAIGHWLIPFDGDSPTLVP